MLTGGAYRPTLGPLRALVTVLVDPDDVATTTRDRAEAFGYTQRTVEKHDKLHVVYWDREPFAWKDGNTWDGAAVKIVDYIARALDLEIVAVANGNSQPVGRVLSLLRTGEADIAAAFLCPTPHRARFIRFSKPIPGFYIPIAAVMRKVDVTTLGYAPTFDQLQHSDDLGGQLTSVLVEKSIGEEYARMFLPRTRRPPVYVPDFRSSSIASRLRKTSGGIAIIDAAVAKQMAEQSQGQMILLRDGTDTTLWEYGVCLGVTPAKPNARGIRDGRCPVSISPSPC